MKKNKAFTLVELLAVIAIIAVILLTFVPSLLNNINNKKIDALDVMYELIETASRNYVDDYDIEIPTIIKIDELCTNYLECPLINPVTEEEIDGCVKILVDDSEYFDYEYLNCNLVDVNLTVELNGGQITNNPTGTYKSGSRITLETPSKDNYEFVGWQVIKGDSTLTNNELSFGIKDTTIYALWQKKVLVTIDLDGGSITEDVSGYYKTNTIIELEPPTKENHDFIGWSLSIDEGILSGNDYTVGNKDVTITALWQSHCMLPKFEYTGSYKVVDDNDVEIMDSEKNILVTSCPNWKIKFLSSGTLTFTDLGSAEAGVDIFLVGGGGHGGNGSNTSEGTCTNGGGGGSGYTKTATELTISANTAYTITVGAGSTSTSSTGGKSSGLGYSASGGNSGGTGWWTASAVGGGNGGSGGGANTKAGGKNGANGTSGFGSGGTGQGTTTCEFGEQVSSGTCKTKMYAYGGNGYGGSAAAANTGNGGNGGNSCNSGGNGGSGIVIIRNTRYLTIHFDANGGSGTVPDDEIGIFDTKFTISNNPLYKDGYKFLGWSTSSTATSAEYYIGDTYTIKGSTTLYAVWEETTFNQFTYTCKSESYGAPPYEVTYTGKCKVIDDSDNNYRIKFLSSGDLTTTLSKTIDLFLVGGGGGAGCGGGAGGGYTATYKNLEWNASETYSIVVGSGGSGGYSSGSAGGASSAFSYSVNGGKGSSGRYNGASGGSGGASHCRTGGSNGGSGGTYSNSSDYKAVGGSGQGTTTKEFGESSGTLYSGGGGGGTRHSTSSWVGAGSGGSGGGGSGDSGNGKTNTGGGGGGGSSSSGNSIDEGDECSKGGTGGSGIVIIRNAR